MELTDRERADNSKHWLVVGDEARSIEEAEGYALRCANINDHIRIVVYCTPLNDENFNDRMVD